MNMDAIADAAAELSNKSRKLEERMDAIDPEKIYALWERPGTPGEKAAAASALKRIGIDPETYKKPKQTQKQTQKQTNAKSLSVYEIVYTCKQAGGPVIRDTVEIEAYSPEEAKMKLKKGLEDEIESYSLISIISVKKVQ
jgi:predicted metal-binding transcription factor (methanogenesis marker protein 9)